MQVIPGLLLLSLWTTLCRAQLAEASAGPPAFYPPAPPAPANSPPITTTTTSSLNYLTQCKPGELIPGPTCTSFYMCVGWDNSATRRVRFECASGTVFIPGLKACSFGEEAALCGSAPPPAALLPVGPPISPSPVGPPISPSPVGPSVSPGQESCANYELDQSGVFDCPEPGYFPAATDCAQFYQCIHTMNCIVKGFLFRCPDGYIFDTKQTRCAKVSKVGECTRLSDSVQTHKVIPVPVISPENLEDFFGSSVYWDVMEYLPEEPQKLVPIPPASFSRGAGGGSPNRISS